MTLSPVALPNLSLEEFLRLPETKPASELTVEFTRNPCLKENTAAYKLSPPQP